MKTHPILSAIVLVFLISCDRLRTPPASDSKATTHFPSSAAPKPQEKSAQPADPIASIREKVERINTMKLQSRHIEFICDEKMMIDYFYADGEIVKITVDFGTIGDVYAREAYYYDSGELIFNYEFVEGGPACEGCIKKDVYRSYIVGNQVIKYLRNKTEGECRKCEFTSSSRQYRLLRATTDEEVKQVLCG
jgi:hypothetical protein